MQTEDAVLTINEMGEAEEHSCPECGTAGGGAFCHNCGEQMETHLFSVKHYVKEIFHDFAVFDTKFFRTIPALLFKPGFLSREYLAGRRRRYLTPARLYTLIAFFSFFALGYYLNSELMKLFHEIVASNGKSEIYFQEAKGEKALQYAQTLLKFTIEVSPYVLLLVSTPLFALAMKIFYWRRRMLFAEHLVFSFHFYAFSLIVFIGSMFLQTNLWFAVAGVIFLIYLYFALKKFYSDHGFVLIVRLLACSIAYLNIAIFALGATTAIAYGIGYQLGEMPNGNTIGKFGKAGSGVSFKFIKADSGASIKVVYDTSHPAKH